MQEAPLPELLSDLLLGEEPLEVTPLWLQLLHLEEVAGLVTTLVFLEQAHQEAPVGVHQQDQTVRRAVLVLVEFPPPPPPAKAIPSLLRRLSQGQSRSAQAARGPPSHDSSHACTTRRTCGS